MKTEEVTAPSDGYLGRIFSYTKYSRRPVQRKLKLDRFMYSSNTNSPVVQLVTVQVTRPQMSHVPSFELIEFFRSTRTPGHLVAPSAKRPSLDFSSGRDLRAVSFRPRQALR